MKRSRRVRAPSIFCFSLTPKTHGDRYSATWEHFGNFRPNTWFWQGFHWCWGIFCSQRSILVHSWSSGNGSVGFVYFFLRDLRPPTLLFYDIMPANNFLYCFWILLLFIAKFWFSFFAIMRETSDIMTQNRWKSIKTIDFHWFWVIISEVLDIVAKFENQNVTMKSKNIQKQ